MSGRSPPKPAPDPDELGFHPSVFAQELPGGPLRRVFDYWLAGIEGGCLPGRRHIAPEELKDVLPRLFLIDVAEGGERLRYRLIGTRVAAWSGGDATGRNLDDPSCGKGRHAFIEMVRSVVRERRPHLTLQMEAIFGGSYCMFDRLMLPLAADGRNVDMVLGVADMRPVARTTSGG